MLAPPSRPAPRDGIEPYFKLVPAAGPVAVPLTGSSREAVLWKKASGRANDLLRAMTKGLPLHWAAAAQAVYSLWFDLRKVSVNRDGNQAY